jgi:hypothetical protein
MKYLITESQASETIRQLLEKYGMEKLSNILGITPEKIISITGITGSKKDMIYLAKILMEKDFPKTGLRYCDYQIIPTQYSFDLVMFIPEPSPENRLRYMFDEGTVNIYNEIISKMLRYIILENVKIWRIILKLLLRISWIRNILVLIMLR